MTAPAPDAPFSDKMAYYRTQHTAAQSAHGRTQGSD
jgi:hypothetical protein